MTEQPKEIFSLAECSDFMRVSKGKVLSWIHSGKLTASNVSDSSVRPRWLIKRSDIESFLAERVNQKPILARKPKTKSAVPKIF